MSMLPETWELHAKSEATKLVTLNKSSPEYISVRDGMLRTSGGPIHVLQVWTDIANLFQVTSKF